VLVPAGREQAFVEAARAVVAKCFPDMAATPDYTASSMTATTSACRATRRCARARRAEIEPLSTASADATRRKLPPLALLNVDDGMRVMQDEIFGPLLPVLPYRTSTRRSPM
jgi:acyl-CoA reductase-like NAD-dependent aldehyde dehydrogenase